MARRLSEAAVRRWAITWTIVLGATLVALGFAGNLLERPLWTFVAIVSVAASAMLSIAASRIDNTLVISVAPAMLLLALSSVDTVTALFVWGLGNYIGLFVQLRDYGDAAEEASYRLGAGLVVAAVWELLRLEEGAFWWLSAAACVALYAVILFLISTVRLLVVTRLGIMAGLRGVLVKRAAVAWVVMVVLADASLGLQRLFVLTGGPSYNMALTGGAIMIILGMLVYVVGTQREYRLLVARLEGTLDATLDLPWNTERSIEEHALQFASTAMPQHTIELRSKPGRNINEIHAPMGDVFLIARRGNYQSPFLPQDQRVLDGVASIAEIMEDARNERDRLAREALTDELTGLLNYRAFRERLIAVAATTQRPFAVVYLDVDNFKDVNDTFGHETGNEVLRALASRMNAMLAAPDVVARVGGDEFVLILTDVADEPSGHRRATELITEVSAPFVMGATVCTVTLSYGLAFAEGGDLDATALIAASDERMYQARGSDVMSSEGRDAMQLMRVSEGENRDLVRAVEAVVRENRVGLVYQPIVDCEFDRIVALEALFRPLEEALSDVPVQLLVHEARRLGLMTELSAHVIETAGADMRRFGEIAPELRDVHVNIDLAQMLDSEFIDRVARVHELGEARITLELSETSLNQVRDDVYDELMRLREQVGVQIALDDFGRDAAALRAMVDYPLDVLKLDKSLARGMEAGKRQKLMRYMLLLTEHLDIDLVVEGVEDQQICEQLASTGVRYMQGYYFSVPLSAEALIERLSRSGLQGRLGEV